MKNLPTEPQHIQLTPHILKKNFITEEFSKSHTKAWTNSSTFGKAAAELVEQHGKMRLTQEKVLKMLNN